MSFHSSPFPGLPGEGVGKHSLWTWTFHAGIADETDIDTLACYALAFNELILWIAL